MNHTNTLRYSRLLAVCVLSTLVAVHLQAIQQDVFDKAIRISKNRGTVYELLRDISEQAGYSFIYDSQIIENDKVVKVTKGNYALRDAIYLITGNNGLQIDQSGAYILLRLPTTSTDTRDGFDQPEQDLHFIVKGALYDQQTREPVMFASIHVLQTSMGVITNRDGEFQLTFPDTLQHHKVRFSHIGYESQETELALLKDGFIDVGMKPMVIPLQEVTVNAVNPVQTVQDMLANRDRNYASEPACLTAFYREGINRDDRNIDLTESILQVYKTGYQKKASFDQVKLIKKRRIISGLATDSIFPKMRSGIQSCLILDVVKEMPDFIALDHDSQYNYSYKGKNMIDERPVHIIAFQQKDHVLEPLYCGELYIEDGNKALVELRFEVNASHVDKATNSFIDKKPVGLRINLQEAKYRVSYKPSNDGYYYTNHVRGDVSFKVRRKNRLFNSQLHFWFEMATCEIDTNDVKPFPANERLSTRRIFAETKSVYDKNFWEKFNIILPEEGLKSAFTHNLNEVLITNP